MSNVICYTRPDGGVSIVIPMAGFRLVLSATDATQPETELVRFDPPIYADRLAPHFEAVDLEPEQEYLARIVEKDVPADATNVRIVEQGDLPLDRLFRDAWRDDGKALAVDIAAAKIVVRDRIRIARNGQFSPLDVTASQLQSKAALGTLSAADKQKLADIETQRQKLRDAPADPRIDAAATVDDLKVLLP